MSINLKTLVVAGGIPIDVEPWQRALNKVLSGKAVALKNRDQVAFTTNNLVVYIPSIICIINTYFIGRLTFVSTVPLNRRNLWSRDGGHCVYCNGKISTEEVTFDHIVPQGQGGKTSWTNVVCSCKTCNNRKDNRTPEQANMKLLKRATIPKLSKKVVAKVVRKLGIETIQEESWRGYWDVTLIN